MSWRNSDSFDDVDDGFQRVSTTFSPGFGRFASHRSFDKTGQDFVKAASYRRFWHRSQCLSKSTTMEFTDVQLALIMLDEVLQLGRIGNKVFRNK